MRIDLGDDDILREAKEADVVGIDAPFGWPRFFVEAVAAHDALRPWPVKAWDGPNRRRLRLRLTDQRVHSLTGLTPLSVSSDTIAIPAARCASLIGRMGVLDRSGDGRVFEVYPAGALLQWGFRHKGYKGRKNAGALGALLADFGKAAPWLSISREHGSLCSRSDDAFDALVAGVVARAASKGLTPKPGPQEIDEARVEGWIAVPERGSLSTVP